MIWETIRKRLNSLTIGHVIMHARERERHATEKTSYIGRDEGRNLRHDRPLAASNINFAAELGNQLVLAVI